jgi:putative transposase
MQRLAFQRQAQGIMFRGVQGYRTRYFTDSGIIGSKDFVSGNYRRFKDLFMSKRDKIPRPVAGSDGIFSLKRLMEG